jgi:hypothetical protein
MSEPEPLPLYDFHDFPPLLPRPRTPSPVSIEPPLPVYIEPPLPVYVEPPFPVNSPIETSPSIQWHDYDYYIPPQVEIPQVILPADPNDHWDPSRKANAIHDPPRPITIKWRCCQSTCNDKARKHRSNCTHTTTHFKCIKSPSGKSYQWYPAYRGEDCPTCGHQACEICLFLAVEGPRSDCWETEWEKVQKDGRYIWVKIGIWDLEGAINDHNYHNTLQTR